MSNDIDNTQSPFSQQPQPTQQPAGQYQYRPQTPPPQQQSIFVQQARPQTNGCFVFFLQCLGVVAVMLVCFFMLMLGSFFVIGAGVRALQTMGGDASFQFGGSEQPLNEKYISGNASANGKIVVLKVEGMITSEEEGFIVKQIKQIQKDSDVVAVVLRVDSPGGTMSGSDYYHNLLKKMKAERNIPIVVSMGSIAASGGYYIAMVGDEIYAEPSTITGSIGVIVALFNGAELCKKIGIESTPITSGQHKAMGNFAKPMSDAEKEIWQNLVDDSFKRFKQIIREGRKEFQANPEKLDSLATGQIYTANEAVANKLIDKIGFLDDAVEQARTLAGVTERDSKVIRYKKKSDFFETLLESRSNADSLLSGKAITDKTTPKVMLLCPNVLP